MKENEWISTRDAMPGIGCVVKIMYQGDELTSEFYYSNSKNKLVFYYNDHVHIDPENVSQWKKIPEKRPDFSKLKEGDLVILSTKKSDSFIVGYIVEKTIDYDSFAINPCNKVHYSGSCYTFRNNAITKITRINLEKQTFEEI